MINNRAAGWLRLAACFKQLQNNTTMTTYNFYSIVASFTSASGKNHCVLFHVQETTKDAAKAAIENYLNNSREVGPPLHGVIMNDYVRGHDYIDYSSVILRDENEAALHYRMEYDRLKSLEVRVKETEDAMRVIEMGIWNHMRKIERDYAVFGGLIWKAADADGSDYTAKPVGEV